jgi:beta-lactam-binding protein with PASTA domain
VFADTATPSTPSTSGRAYAPAIIRVQVPDLRQQVLAEAQKIAADSRFRVQVSGDAAVDPTKVIVVRQTPDPNTSAAVGSVITVVVQTPNTSQPPPSRAVVVPSRLTSVPDLLQKSLMEARPLVENARLRLEVSGGAPEDTSHAIVVSQNPAAGTRAVVGSAVTVSVRMETAERVVVPELRPRSLADAQRLVASVRLKLEVSGNVPGDSSRATVATQKPSAGTRVPVNTPVVVTLQAPSPLNNSLPCPT